jgi:hypothetical protein
METTSHTIGDLLSAYSDMLAYIRLDADDHSEADCEPDNEFCPTRLYQEAIGVYKDHQLFHLLSAAPDLLKASTEALRILGDIVSDLEDDKGESACVDHLSEAIAKAA